MKTSCGFVVVNCDKYSIRVDQGKNSFNLSYQGPKMIKREASIINLKQGYQKDTFKKNIFKFLIVYSIIVVQIFFPFTPSTQPILEPTVILLSVVHIFTKISKALWQLVTSRKKKKNMSVNILCYSCRLSVYYKCLPSNYCNTQKRDGINMQKK